MGGSGNIIKGKGVGSNGGGGGKMMGGEVWEGEFWSSRGGLSRVWDDKCRKWRGTDGER